MKPALTVEGAIGRGMYIKVPGLIWDAVFGVHLKFGSWLLRLLNRHKVVIAVVLCVAIAIAVLVLASVFWEWMSTGESGSSTIRNVGLVVAGLIALPLALWRSDVADRQAKTAQESLLNERYQKGSEMLGNEVLSVRLGGIYALQRLAKERPEQYHVQIMRLFCAFARQPTKDSGLEVGQVQIEPGTLLGLRQDLEAIILAIRSRPKSRIEIERKEDYRLDLRGVVLPGEQFLDLDLSNAWLHHSKLPNANIANTNLTDAILDYADLKKATFYGVKLKGTRFYNANLSGAGFNDMDLSMADFGHVNLSCAILASTNLSGANFQHAIIANALLTRANLAGAVFLESNLSGARLMNANLTGAHFWDANLKGARLTGANLSGVEFSNGGQQTAKGLTQFQLDLACADPKNPPRLTGVLDSETGEPLEWRGKTVKSM